MYSIAIPINQDNADIVGEYLRQCFFKYREYDWTWADRVKCLPTTKEQIEDDWVTWTNTVFRGTLEIEQIGLVACRWFWDNDYYLEFTFPDGSYLCNDDAKKNRGWLFKERLKETT